MTTAASPNPTSAGRPPSVLRVVGHDAAAAYHAPVDWSDWYLTDEDDMGQSPEQHAIIGLLEPSLTHLMASRGRDDLFVGADAFFGWMEHQPLVRVSPDIYVMPAPPGPPWPNMWETWRAGIEPPLVAIEVVSERWTKDYRVNPPKYAALGAEELIVFDPQAPAEHPTRVPLQIYRETEDGLFVAVYAGDGPAWSLALEAWVVVVQTPAGPRARLAVDREGSELVPTHLELAAQERERAEHERERAEHERERAEHERESTARERELAAQERARADAAERRNAELFAELARLRADCEPE